MRKTSFPPCSHYHPQRHALHGDNSCHGTKAAFGRSKSPPLAVKKQLIVSPSLTLPKGREFILAVFEEVVVHTFPLGKAGMGPLFWFFSFPVGKVRMGPVGDKTHPWQLCRSCDYIAQG